MVSKELLKEFNKHFRDQIVYVIEKQAYSDAKVSYLHVFNPVIDVLAQEATEQGLKTRFLLPGQRIKPSKGANDRIVANRLSIQIRRSGNGHKIGRILNY